MTVSARRDRIGRTVLFVLFAAGILAAVINRRSAPAPEVVAPQPTTATSATCGTITGKTPQDVANLQQFCDKAIPADLAIVGASAMESLLWIKVTRTLADTMRADRLSTEQVVKNWMAAWKPLSGSQAVSVSVEWQDVEIAKGDTSVFSGDVVTIK